MNLKKLTYFSLGLMILLCTAANKVQAEKISQATEEQIQRTREQEGKNIAGSITRTQQAYHFEKQTFADSITLLGITVNSNYYGQPIITAETNKATVIVGATQEGLRSYSGAITYAQGEYSQILCQTDAPSQTAPPPIINDTQLTCPPGTNAINKVQAEKISQATQDQIQQDTKREGRNIASVVTRSQKVYHFEKGTFANSITLLGVTVNSNYYGQPIITAETNKAIVTVGATQEGLKSYSGAITYAQGEYSQILCQTDAPSQTAPPPIINDTELICPPGTNAIR